jgi:hypothetical protein
VTRDSRRILVGNSSETNTLADVFLFISRKIRIGNATISHDILSSRKHQGYDNSWTIQMAKRYVLWLVIKSGNEKFSLSFEFFYWEILSCAVTFMDIRKDRNNILSVYIFLLVDRNQRSRVAHIKTHNVDNNNHIVDPPAM